MVGIGSSIGRKSYISTGCKRSKIQAEFVRYTSGLISDVRPGKWHLHEYLKLNPPLQKVQLLGEQTFQDVLTERIRHLIASLSLLIEKMKKDNYCFHMPLKLPDLMVDEFSYMVIAEGALLEKLTRAGSSSRAYKSAAAVIKEIIGDTVPKDIEHLMSKMKMRKTHRHLILVHPSCIPLPSRSQAYLDAHDILCANFSEIELTRVLLGIQWPLNQWDQVTNNKLLKEFFDQVKTPTKLFLNLSNLQCDTLEHYKSLGKYTKNQVRTLTLCKFGKVLPCLRRILWKQGLLLELETENYFRLPGSACCSTGFCLTKDIRLTTLQSKVKCDT